MGIRLKIEGADTIELDEHNMGTFKYLTDTPDDSNARSSDVYATMHLTGKIITALESGFEVDDTQKIAEWSLVRAEQADCYRKVTVEIVSASKVVRKYHFTHGFIVDYDEEYGVTEGEGTFRLIVRQKKDLFNKVTIEGGFEAPV